MGLKSMKFPDFKTPVIPQGFMTELEVCMKSFHKKLKENKLRGPMEATFSLFNSNLKRPKFEKDKSKLLGFKLTTGDKIAKSSEEQIKALTEAFTNAYAIVLYGWGHYKDCVGHEIIAKYFDELDKERKGLMKREKLNVDKLRMDIAEKERVEWDNRYKFYAKRDYKGVNELLKILNIKPTTPYYNACEKIYDWCEKEFKGYIDGYSATKKNIDKHIKEAEFKLESVISEFEKTRSHIKSTVKTVARGKIEFEGRIEELRKDDEKLAKAIDSKIKKQSIKIDSLYKSIDALLKKSYDIKLNLNSKLLVAKGDEKNEEILINVSNYFDTYCTSVDTFLGNLSNWVLSTDELLKSLKDVVESHNKLSNSLAAMISVCGTRQIKGGDARFAPRKEIKDIASKIDQDNSNITTTLNDLDSTFATANNKVDKAITAYHKQRSAIRRHRLALAFVGLLELIHGNIGSIFTIVDAATYNIETGV